MALELVERGGDQPDAGGTDGMAESDRSSGNFDEDVFEDPFSFDVLRDPNPHLSFGGRLHVSGLGR